MEWTSVKIGMPDHLDRVLVCFEGGHVLMASYQIRVGSAIGVFLPFFADGRQETERVVTHWMPIPDPPKML